MFRTRTTDWFTAMADAQDSFELCVSAVPIRKFKYFALSKVKDVTRRTILYVHSTTIDWRLVRLVGEVGLWKYVL